MKDFQQKRSIIYLFKLDRGREEARRKLLPSSREVMGAVRATVTDMR